MAAEVPFHPTFGKAFLSEAEAEARTAVCTKLSLEQLDQEPFFRAKLFWFKARKFVADRFARDEEEDDVQSFHKSSKNSYFAFVCIVLLALYCGVSILKHGLDNPVLSVRDGFLSTLGLRYPTMQTSKSVASASDGKALPQVSPAPILPASQMGWCHTAKLWKYKPSCGPYPGIWDAPISAPSAKAADLHTKIQAALSAKQEAGFEDLDNKVQAVVELMHTAYSQQDKVNAIIYHLLGDLKSELSSLRQQKASSTPEAERSSAPQAPPASSQYVAFAMCAILFMGGAIHLHNQNKALRASQGLIMSQLAASASRAESAQKAMEDLQRSQRRMERATDEARDDTLQMHESLRDSFSGMEARIDRLDTVEGAIGTLGASMGAVSVEVLSWANEGRAELAECREVLDGMHKERQELLAALDERDAIADQQAARLQELSGDLQAQRAQLARLNASMENSALLQQQMQEALISVEEELAEREEALKATAASALDIEQKLAASEGFCTLLRSENEELQENATQLEEALEKTQRWVSEDEVLRGALEAELASAQAAQDALQQKLQAAEEQARSALAEADRQRKAAGEKDKLLHYKKYELECMKKAVEQLQHESAAADLSLLASAPLPSTP